jgi:quercetin dioxygenase-like cupin family protein
MYEIFNGEVDVRNMKVLIVKKGEQLLGNHWHPYPEVMYILKGSARYRMKNIDTNEIEDYDLVAGDVVFRTGRIIHAGWFSEDSIVVDGACSTYISQDFNDVREDIL